MNKRVSELMELLSSDKVDEEITLLFLSYACHKFAQENPLELMRGEAVLAGILPEWERFEALLHE